MHYSRVIRIAVVVIAFTYLLPAFSMAAPSALDRSFGRGGFVAFGGPSDHAAMAQTANGLVVVDGPRRIVRLLDSGMVDREFGSGGSVALPRPTFITHVAERRGGGVFLVGSTKEEEAELIVFALTQQGDLDPTFGVAGQLLARTKMYASGVDVDSTGRLVLAGAGIASAQPATRETGDTMVVRITADGQLDSTFGTGGIVHLDREKDEDDGASGVAIHTDGTIIVGLWSDGNDSELHVAMRLTSAGAQDMTYGLNGTARSRDSEQQVADSIALRRDGSALFGAGSYGAKAVVIAYTATGSVDRSFGRNGVASVAPTGGATDQSNVQSAVWLDVDQQGRILVGSALSTRWLDGSELNIARFTQLGRPDLAWGALGAVAIDVGANSTDHVDALSLSIDPRGRPTALVNVRRERRSKTVSSNVVVRLSGVEGGRTDPGATVKIVCSRKAVHCNRSAHVVVGGKAIPSGAVITVRASGYSRMQDASPGTDRQASRSERRYVYRGADKRINELFWDPGLYTVEVRIAATDTTRFSVVRKRVRIR